MLMLKRGEGRTLYEQLYAQIREQILTGELPGGARLPATRRLAQELGVGRITVENAYQQLVLEGYATARVGAGYTVCTLTGDERRAAKAPAFAPARISAPAEPPPRFECRVGRADARTVPYRALSRHLAAYLADAAARGPVAYPMEQGEAALRESIRRHVRQTRGIDCAAGSIVVTHSTQYSLNILSTLLRTEGGPVAVEEPGHAGARLLFAGRGFPVCPIPMEPDGLDTGALARSGARILHVTPSHQYPTGAVLSVKKRAELIEWASRGGWILENDYDCELRYGARPVPALRALDREGRIAYMGVFSRAISAEMGAGYVILPDALLERFRQTYMQRYNSVPPMIQNALARFMETGEYARHLDRFRVFSRKKHDALCAGLAAAFGERVLTEAAGAGLHLLLTVRAGLSEAALLERAAARGALLQSASVCWAEPENAPTGQVLLGYGGLDEKDVPALIQTLADAWFDA